MRLSYRVNIFSRPRIAALVIKSHETDNNTTQLTHTHVHLGQQQKGFSTLPKPLPTLHSLAITYPNMPLGNYS